MQTLHKKSKGLEVGLLQSRLVLLGHLSAFGDDGRTNIDSNFGAETAAAVNRWKAATGRTQNGIVTDQDAADIGLYDAPRSKYYTLADYNVCQRDNAKTRAAAPYWKDCPQKLWPNVYKVLFMLDVMTDEMNRRFAAPGEFISIYIYCGYRDGVYNQKMKGAKNSEHLRAAAADVYCITKDKEDRQKYLLRYPNNQQLAEVYRQLFPHGGGGFGNDLIDHLDFVDRRYWYSNEDKTKEPQYGANYAANMAKWKARQKAIKPERTVHNG